MSIQTLEEEKIRLISLQQESKNIREELKPLLQIPEVLRYIELEKQQQSANEKLSDVGDRVMLLTMECCNHLTISIGSDYDPTEQRRYPKYYCLRCGLTNAYSEWGYSNNDLASKINIMWNKIGDFACGIHLVSPKTLSCRGLGEAISLGTISNKILEEFPQIDNKELLQRILLKTIERVKK